MNIDKKIVKKVVEDYKKTFDMYWKIARKFIQFTVNAAMLIAGGFFLIDDPDLKIVCVLIIYIIVATALNIIIKYLDYVKKDI